MKPEDFNTKEQITWCKGCPNFGILMAVKETFSELTEQGKIKAQNISIASGIGCHAKIYDYLNVNAFYGLHGRVLPLCMGMKIANPQLEVVGFGGDGDTFAEGIGHFVHACRYNTDLTMVVHDNQVFGLTTGQATPTSEKGYVGVSTPLGTAAEPLNPLALALISGASFVARSFALDLPHLKETLKEAILHKGFSFVDILQPCLAYHNSIPYFQKNIYKLEPSHNSENFDLALKGAREWDYSFNQDKKVPIGIFYKKERPTFEQSWPQLKIPWHLLKRDVNWPELTEEFR